MKKIALIIITVALWALWACNKDTESEKFRLLTAHIWTSDSLLAEGIDASGPGQILEKFKGDAKFNKDYKGYFGKYTGTWKFAYDETNIVIDSDSLQVAITTNIVLLNEVSLKVTTAYPNVLNPSNPLDIRMTFKTKE
jgi:hypothetical protein